MTWSPKANRPGFVGQEIPGCEVRITGDDEKPLAVGELDGTTVIGLGIVTNTYQPNYGTIFMRLKPWEERKDPKLKVKGIMASLQKQYGVKSADMITAYRLDKGENVSRPEGERKPVLEVVYSASKEIRGSIVFATLIVPPLATRCSPGACCRR